MEIELQTTTKHHVEWLEVMAGVRYWDDSMLDGAFDNDGKMPLRVGEYWAPVIDLATGVINKWPSGVTAEIHYKVCDAGEYWLLAADGKRVAKWKGSYVPDAFLCQAGDGFGDYIVFKIDGTGQIEGWDAPEVDSDEWAPA